MLTSVTRISPCYAQSVREMEITNTGNQSSCLMNCNSQTDSTNSVGTCSDRVMVTEDRSSQRAQIDKERVTADCILPIKQYSSETPLTISASDNVSEPKHADVLLSNTADFAEDDLKDVIAESLIILASDLPDCGATGYTDDSSEFGSVCENDMSVLSTEQYDDVNGLISARNVDYGLIKDEYWWEHSIDPVKHNVSSAIAAAAAQLHNTQTEGVKGSPEVIQKVKQCSANDMVDVLSETAYLNPFLSLHCNVNLSPCISEDEVSSSSYCYHGTDNRTVEKCMRTLQQRSINTMESEPVEELKEFLRFRPNKNDFLKPSEIKSTVLRRINKTEHNYEIKHQEERYASLPSEFENQQPTSVSSLVQKFEGVMERNYSRPCTRLSRLQTGVEQRNDWNACIYSKQNRQLNNSGNVGMHGNMTTDLSIHFNQVVPAETDSIKPNKSQQTEVKSTEQCINASSMLFNHMSDEKDTVDGLRGDTHLTTCSNESNNFLKTNNAKNYCDNDSVKRNIFLVEMPERSVTNLSDGNINGANGSQKDLLHAGVCRKVELERFSSFVPFTPVVSPGTHYFSDHCNAVTASNKNTKYHSFGTKRSDLMNDEHCGHHNDIKSHSKYRGFDVTENDSSCSLLINLSSLEKRAEQVVSTVNYNLDDNCLAKFCGEKDNVINTTRDRARNWQTYNCPSTLNEILSDCRDIKNMLREENNTSSDSDDELFGYAEIKSQPVNELSAKQCFHLIGSGREERHLLSASQDSTTYKSIYQPKFSPHCCRHRLKAKCAYPDRMRKWKKECLQNTCVVNDRGDKVPTTRGQIVNVNQVMQKRNEVAYRPTLRRTPERSFSYTVTSSDDMKTRPYIRKCKAFVENVRFDTAGCNINHNNRQRCEMVCSAKIRARCKQVIDLIKVYTNGNTDNRNKEISEYYLQNKASLTHGSKILDNCNAHTRGVVDMKTILKKDDIQDCDENRNNNSNNVDNEKGHTIEEIQTNKEEKIGKKGLAAKASKLFKLSHKRYAKTMKKTRQYLKRRSTKEKENKLEEADKDDNVAVTMALIQENMKSATAQLKNIHAMLGVQKSSDDQISNTDGSISKRDTVSEVDDTSVGENGSSRTTLIEEELYYSDVNTLVPSNGNKSTKSFLKVPVKGVSTQTSDSLGMMTKPSMRESMANRRSVSFAGEVKIPVSPAHGTFVITAYNRSDVISISYVDRSSIRYLPPIFSHFAFVTVTLASIACALSCLWTANGFSGMFTYRWLAVVLLSFLQDIILLEPLKVIAVAMYLTACRERLM